MKWKMGIGAVLILAMLSALFNGEYFVRTAGAEEDGFLYDEDEGAHFYTDGSFTEKIESVDELIAYYTRISVSSEGGDKTYLRIKDGETIKYRPSGDTSMFLLKNPKINNLERVDPEDIEKYLSVKEMDSSVEGDRRYEITFKKMDLYGELLLDISVSCLQEDSDWTDRTLGTDLTVDYMEEGLNISERSEVYYNRYIIWVKIQPECVRGRRSA